MRVVSVRLDEELYRKLRRRAYAANLSLSRFLQPLLEDAAYPGGKYVYSGQDELLAIAMQTFAILSSVASERSPDAFQRGLAHARDMLDRRGLLGEGQGQGGGR